MPTEDVFREINKVVQCQLSIKENYETVQLEKTIQNS